jgi:hypothetical protein
MLFGQVSWRQVKCSLEKQKHQRLPLVPKCTFTFLSNKGLKAFFDNHQSNAKFGVLQERKEKVGIYQNVLILMQIHFAWECQF